MRTTRVTANLAILATTVCAAAAIGASTIGAQAAPTLSQDTRSYVSVGEPVVALTNVTIIDGTGTAPKANQSIVIRNGKIAEVGPAASVSVPQGARSIDLRGQTVIPGIVGMHDHLFYYATGGRNSEVSFTGPRLYLGAGVTTLRTTGAMEPFADVNTKHAIDAGEIPGPISF